MHLSTGRASSTKNVQNIPKSLKTPKMMMTTMMMLMMMIIIIIIIISKLSVVVIIMVVVNSDMTKLLKEKINRKRKGKEKIKCETWDDL